MGVAVREKPKGSGVYWIFINHQGKRKSKKIGKDKKLANEVAKKIEAKLTLSDFDLQANNEKTMSFKDFSHLWLEDYIKPLRRQSTYERYRDMLTRHVYPFLGEKPIDEIKRKEIRNLILMKNKDGLSRSMLCLIRDVISGPMGYAVDEELIEANPVSGILKRLKLERNKKITIEPMTQEEVELFLITCQTYWPGHFTFFLCAFRTGMRLGEILALQWGDIDFNSAFIRVGRSYKRGIVEKPKNGKDRRVDMSDQLTLHLNGLLAYSAPFRPPIPEQIGHPFRLIPATHSGAFRPL